MAQDYDVSLKTVFLREGDGIVRRLLFRRRIVAHLLGEQPKVSNRRADMVVRTEDGSLHHVEFQTSNDPNLPVRMLEYYAYLARAHGEHVFQVVLYLGKESMRLENTFTSPSMDFRFEILNLRDFDAKVLLESDDWADNVLALLARGDPKVALDAVLGRLRAMQGEDREWAAGTLLLLSGILGMEQIVSERLKEADMINLMENKVLGPMIQQKIEEALEEGREQGMERGMERGLERGLERGRATGRMELLREQLGDKFGSLPRWAANRLESASNDDLQVWAKRILRSESLEDTLA